MNYAREVFKIIDEEGETLDGKLHILISSDEYPVTEGDRKYRIYHADGYCFDIEKEWVEQDDSGSEKGEWQFHFYNHWDGFKPLDERDALLLLTKYFNDLKKPNLQRRKF